VRQAGFQIIRHPDLQRQTFLQAVRDRSIERQTKIRRTGILQQINKRAARERNINRQINIRQSDRQINRDKHSFIQTAKDRNTNR